MKCSQFCFLSNETISFRIPLGGYQFPRWAVELVYFSTDKPAAKMVLSEMKSLDDEYSPGVFDVSITILKHVSICF